MRPMIANTVNRSIGRRGNTYSDSDNELDVKEFCGRFVGNF